MGNEKGQGIGINGKREMGRKVKEKKEREGKEGRSLSVGPVLKKFLPCAAKKCSLEFFAVFSRSAWYFNAKFYKLM